MVRVLLIAALAFLASACATKPPEEMAGQRPNFLVVMADDLGYSDIGAYGGEIDTPNLDRLAARGLQFTNFYNLSRCSPSRASLLTGRYPHRVGMGENGGSMDLSVRTLAEELRDAGYATAMAGKWHLTRATPIADPQEHLRWLNHQGHFDRDFGDRATYPAARGFERHYGIIWGVANFFDPFSLVENFTPVRDVPEDYYITDALSDRAAREIETFARDGKPFFLYLAYTAPHWPLHAPERVIDKYRGRYTDGWEGLQRRRYERQVALGLVDPRTTNRPALAGDWRNRPGVPWDRLSPAERNAQAEKMAVHAAMIDVTDQGIGRVLAALERTGQRENTVIIFLSDNGASPETMTAPGYQPGYDRPSETRDGRKIQYGPMQADMGSDTSMAGIGPYWAHAANTPWRYWKAEAYDGGVHTPFIINWPAGMRRPAGRVADYGHVIDIAPTLLDLARVTPRSAGQPPVDGVPLTPAFTGSPVRRSEPLFFEHEGSRAVIEDGWKLVARAPGPSSPDYAPWALYDLSRDRSETRNLIDVEPERAARLAGLWNAWSRAVGAKQRREPK